MILAERAAPTLIAADGTVALNGHGSFDRIMATCSVSSIPEAWADSLREQGALLADLKIGLHAGSLVLLRRSGDVLHGRFLPRWAGFMSARHADRAPDPPAGAERLRGEFAGTTTVDPDPWAGLVPWFLAHLGQPTVTHLARRGPDLDTTVITASDGAWCEVGPSDAEGLRDVRGGGPHDLWGGIEHAHRWWSALGRPGWERIGLTVEARGLHRIWLDEPTEELGSFSR